jgi:hypothetical protein
MENCSKLISYLLHSINQTHIFHLQTTSYAEHKVLCKYYEDVSDLVDGLVESYQGKYGIIRGYSAFGYNDYTDKNQTITYLDGICKTIETLRVNIPDSYLQNQIDTIIELIQSTLYKLKNLN